MKRKPHKAVNERPADLTFWYGDGQCSAYTARITADTKVSIGRTDSKRALGFIVTQGKTDVAFVLDRDQLTELAAFLNFYAPRLFKPLGRKKQQFSPAAFLNLRNA
jgi:hypothetical protein